MKRITNSYHRSMTDAQLGMTADVALVAGEFRTLGVYTVPAGQAFAVGFGDLQGQDSAIGRAYLDLNAAGPTDINGIIRFVLQDANQNTILTLWEGRTETLRTSATDRTQQIPFPIKKVRVYEDYRVVMQCNPDANATATAADTNGVFSCTNYTVQEA